MVLLVLVIATYSNRGVAFWASRQDRFGSALRIYEMYEGRTELDHVKLVIGQTNNVVYGDLSLVHSMSQGRSSSFRIYGTGASAPSVTWPMVFPFPRNAQTLSGSA